MNVAVVRGTITTAQTEVGSRPVTRSDAEKSSSFAAMLRELEATEPRDTAEPEHSEMGNLADSEDPIVEIDPSDVLADPDLSRPNTKELPGLGPFELFVEPNIKNDFAAQFAVGLIPKAGDANASGKGVFINNQSVIIADGKKLPAAVDPYSSSGSIKASFQSSSVTGSLQFERTVVSNLPSNDGAGMGHDGSSPGTAVSVGPRISALPIADRHPNGIGAAFANVIANHGMESRTNGNPTAEMNGAQSLRSHVSAVNTSQQIGMPPFDTDIRSATERSSTKDATKVESQYANMIGSPAAISLSHDSARSQVRDLNLPDRLDIQPVAAASGDAGLADDLSGTGVLRGGHIGSITSATETMVRGPGALAQSVGQQLAVSIQQVDGRQTEIALSPVELGRVRMTISAQDQNLTVVVIADRPETADLMRRHVEGLQQELRSLGYASVTLDFGESAGQSGRDTAPEADGRGTSDATKSDDIAIAADANLPRVAADGSLDLRF